jgi:hypothetical protein
MVEGSELDIVAFRVDGEKYCRKCFHEFPPKQIKFTPIPRAVQRLSCIKNCFKCGKDIMKEGSNGTDQTGNQ